MSPTDTSLWTRWSLSRRLRRAGWIVLFCVLAAQAYVSIFRRENDFTWHYRLGEGFLQGDPYARGGDWYTVGRVMLDAGVATLNLRLARALAFFLSLAALVVSLRLWRAMAEAGDDQTVLPKLSNRRVSAVTLAIMAAYVFRDLDEAGLQVFLLFFLTAAGYALFRGHSLLSGFWLAVAATYKTTPVLFLPLLVWKRQWRASAAMAGFLLLLNLAPALFLGWQTTWRSHQRFFARLEASAKIRDPSQNGIEQPKPINASWQTALARYLQTYPPGHPLFQDHAGFVQFGALGPAAAGRVVKAVLLGLAGLLAWRFRRRWAKANAKPSDDAAARLAPEWAAVCLLCAVLSPLCWKQHLVLALPCVYLVVRSHWSGAKPARWRFYALLAVAALALLTKRWVLGRELSILVASYKPDTLAVSLAMLLCLTLPSTAPPPRAKSLPTRRARTKNPRWPHSAFPAAEAARRWPNPSCFRLSQLTPAPLSVTSAK